MNKATMLGLAMAAITLAACTASSGPEESTGTTEDHFDALCVNKIKAQPGSSAWFTELQKCVADYQAGGAGTVTPAPTAPAPTTPAPAPGGTAKPGGKSCSLATSCINGTCTCGSGPNKGATCNGAVVTGPTACSVLCLSCQ
jgi:hypothetical protein